MTTLREPDANPVRPTDSPWLWGGIFGAGALLALYLTLPKFAWRQPQLERQFKARVQAGQAIDQRPMKGQEATGVGRYISLQPLGTVIVVLLLLGSVAFWTRRWWVGLHRRT